MPEKKDLRKELDRIEENLKILQKKMKSDVDENRKLISQIKKDLEKCYHRSSGGEKEDFSGMSVEDIRLEHKFGRPVTSADIYASVTCNKLKCLGITKLGCNFLCEGYDPKPCEGSVYQDPRFDEGRDHFIDDDDDEQLEALVG